MPPNLQVADRDFESGRDTAVRAWPPTPGMKKLLLRLGFGALLVARAADTEGVKSQAKTLDTNEVAVIQTVKGQMVVEFWSDAAPNTIENFKKLARSGFYDGTAFHRIISGFMIQGGDPLTKDPNQSARWGTGDPGYKIKAEFNGHKHQFGVLSMARSQSPDSAGCQFFVCLGDAAYLDYKYTTFGRLIKGDEVLRALGSVSVEDDGHGNRSRPVDRAGIESIKIVDRSTLKL